MGKYFGTDGFRGEVNVDLTADHAFAIGRFLGRYFARGDEPARIIIGKDTRRSSYMLEYALAGGLTASGADAYLLHVTTTPSVSYVCRTEDFDCGIMISASHNPYHDNGIKLLNAQGEKMDDKLIALLEAYLDAPSSLPFARRRHIGRTVDYWAGRNRYIGYLISLGMYSFKGMRIGLDCANGSAWNIAKAVFDALGAQTFVIHAEPNGFNINENSGSTHIEALRRLVLEKHLDVGFAYDGDADRCLCVDEQGNLVTGDHILYLCARFMQEKGELDENTVVTTVMSNYGLQRALNALDIECAQTNVGDRFVYEYMTRNGCRLGGEPSGHIIFSKYASTGDGILTSLKVMEVMLARKKSLHDLCQDFIPCPQILENISVSDKEAALSSPKVQQAIAQAKAKMEDHGRILVRASGTEPKIRIMAEGDSEQLCRECVQQIAAALSPRPCTP